MGTQTLPTGTFFSVDGILDYHNYKKTKNLEWDPELFKNVTLKMGSPSNTIPEVVKVLIVQSKTFKWTMAFFRSYIEKYQELLDLQGDYETMEVSTTVRTKNGQKIATQKVHKVVTDGAKRDLWEKLQYH